MPQFMYHFPSGALLGVVASLWLLALAGISLWRSKPGRRASAVALGGVALLLGATEALVSVYTLLEKTSVNDKGSWHLSIVMTSAAAAALGVLLSMLVGALIRRTSVLLAGLLVALPLASANLSQLMLQLTDESPWALAVSLCWIATPLSLVVFVMAVGMDVIRSYGGAKRSGYESGLNDGYNKALAEFERRHLEQERLPIADADNKEQGLATG